ncbi:hypothetical protein [Natrinema hispanicum]|uniref:hypothetical protein n=1 Tax=Natrinema hispanicum TaxID=392421 RepID=UPI00111486F6|nr:hypothetical protein [Natrinema hispanicum]
MSDTRHSQQRSSSDRSDRYRPDGVPVSTVTETGSVETTDWLSTDRVPPTVLSVGEPMGV